MKIDAPRVKAIWPWLKEASYVWLSILIIVIALLISLRPATTEPTIRLTGLALQLAGIWTVIWGISETRSLFGHPSITSKAKSWMSRCPFFQRNIVLACAGASMSSSSSSMIGYGTHSVGKDATIEARIDAIEKNVALIHERISDTKKEADENFQKTRDEMSREIQSRKKEDSDIRVRLEATGTGGVHISAIGASWLFVGAILSTAAVEIEKFLK